MLFATVFGLTFLAELPDKTAFAALLLAARRRRLAVFCGAAAAFVIQSAVAVAFGRALGLLPRKAVHIGAGVLFMVMAGFMFARRKDAGESTPGETASFWSDAWTAFLVIFVAEWGDLTQLSTAALAARYERPATVFCAAVLALWCVTALAVTVGGTLSRRVSPLTLNRVASAAFAAMGLALLLTGRGS